MHNNSRRAKIVRHPFIKVAGGIGIPLTKGGLRGDRTQHLSSI
ncbi:hypothetical protein O53_4844 [Microcystis aeruginosa TAIHU98]|uniref:Uncharacterized protein n=1 Tax=Microcystis aeruginosa TAIHU98 TaxID=1134457 RepID=L7E122_MICAE|nr:hypothetical protein O53_4844 [Microcystis aeruginosa TAIHU98]